MLKQKIVKSVQYARLHVTTFLHYTKITIVFQYGRLQVLIQKNSFEQGMYRHRQVGGEWLAPGLGGVLLSLTSR